MRVDLALLADAATVDSAGKLNILGIFDSITSTRFPAKHGLISLVLRFAAGWSRPGNTPSGFACAGRRGRTSCAWTARSSSDPVPRVMAGN